MQFETSTNKAGHCNLFPEGLKIGDILPHIVAKGNIF